MAQSGLFTSQRWNCARHSPALNARHPPTLKETLMKKTLVALAAAATVATANAAAPGPGYVVYPAYAAPLPGPGCYWTRMPVYDMYGNVVGWRGRPVAVCQ